MAIPIPRDVGQTIDLRTDAHALAEYEGFAADVPHTDGLIAAANNLPNPDPANPDNTPANAVRAERMLREGFLADLQIGDDLPTPDLVPSSGATSEFERRGLDAQPDIVVPSSAGGTWAQIETWSFEALDNNSGNGTGWPAPPIRVVEGRTIHVLMGSRTGPHTIHHHGIEPTPMNDGVGHLTFEVSGGQYTYQWHAAEAGTYFYHCHRNTVLHFERGMYGPLIIDPDVPGAPFPLGSAGQTYVEDALVPYDAEALWVVDDIDTRWHGYDAINYGAGRNPITNTSASIQNIGPGKFNEGDNAFVLVGDSDRLHDFDPNVFVVTGVAAPVNPTPRPEVGGPSIPRTVPEHTFLDTAASPLPVGVRARVAAGPGPNGQRRRLLIRTLNAAYCHTRWKFPVQIPGQVIAADGRTFGKLPWGKGYSRPLDLGQDLAHQFQLSVARRWDVLLDTTDVSPGIYYVEVTVHSSVGDHQLVKLNLPITIQ